MVENKVQIQPNSFNFSLFKKKNTFLLYLYNNKYSILLKLKNLKIISSQAILLKSQIKNKIHLYNYIKQINNYMFIKIKFTGKGYKIKKNNNKNIVLLFNRAHITNLWWRNLFLKKLKKYKIYIRYTPINKNIVGLITATRNVNIFTKKGLRRSKQVLFKKKGKK